MERLHAPDEFLGIRRLREGMRAWEELRRLLADGRHRLADASPHPNKAHAAWGWRADRLEPDPATPPVVRWMFAQRLAGHSVARITRALNDAGIFGPHGLGGLYLARDDFARC
jgi:site-specific DNA recombinase